MTARTARRAILVSGVWLVLVLTLWGEAPKPPLDGRARIDPWKRCTGSLAGLQCSQLRVPLARGASESLALRLYRLGASERAGRALLVLPGGPGQLGRDLAGSQLVARLHAELPDTDVILFDDRSASVRTDPACIAALERYLEGSWTLADAISTRQAQAEAGQSCAAPDGLPLDVEARADDLEALIGALEQTVDVLAVSYAAVDLVHVEPPPNLGQVVFDSPVHPGQTVEERDLRSSEALAARLTSIADTIGSERVLQALEGPALSAFGALAFVMSGDDATLLTVLEAGADLEPAGRRYLGSVEREVWDGRLVRFLVASCADGAETRAAPFRVADAADRDGDRIANRVRTLVSGLAVPCTSSGRPDRSTRDWPTFEAATVVSNVGDPVAPAASAAAFGRALRRDGGRVEIESFAGSGHSVVSTSPDGLRFVADVLRRRPPSAPGSGGHDLDARLRRS